MADSLATPVGCVLEGGYALGALGRSVAATMEVLVEPDGAAAHEPAGPLVEEARARLLKWWPSLL